MNLWAVLPPPDSGKEVKVFTSQLAAEAWRYYRSPYPIDAKVQIVSFEVTLSYL